MRRSGSSDAQWRHQTSLVVSVILRAQMVGDLLQLFDSLLMLILDMHPFFDVKKNGIGDSLR
jgi:hypothetical protein